MPIFRKAKKMNMGKIVEPHLLVSVRFLFADSYTRYLRESDKREKVYKVP